MPVHQLKYISSNQAYLIWKIQESETELLNTYARMPEENKLYEGITHPRKRLEWLSARIAYQLLCSEMDIAYSPILKDINGRPYLANEKLHVSISHSFPYVTIGISHYKRIGIDIQVPTPKLKAIKSKFLNKKELENTNGDLIKLCIYWCAKEAVYKAYGKKGLSFLEININSFNKSTQGSIYAQLPGKDTYLIHYWVISSYVLAWCQPDESTRSQQG